MLVRAATEIAATDAWRAVVEGLVSRCLMLLQLV